MAKAREKVAGHSVKATFDRVCQERASEEIAERIEVEAETCNADLIVIGTHGRRGVRRLVLGSVAEGLIRVSNRPVLLVRGDK
ncbi:Universal stress protein family protein [compost metagenome]